MEVYIETEIVMGVEMEIEVGITRSCVLECV